jgi:hypothetical protein
MTQQLEDIASLPHYTLPAQPKQDSQLQDDKLSQHTANLQSLVKMVAKPPLSHTIQRKKKFSGTQA